MRCVSCTAALTAPLYAGVLQALSSHVAALSAAPTSAAAPAAAAPSPSPSRAPRTAQPAVETDADRALRALELVVACADRVLGGEAAECPDALRSAVTALLHDALGVLLAAAPATPAVWPLLAHLADASVPLSAEDVHAGIDAVRPAIP